MYDGIMVPLDGSAFAEAALPLATALSRKTSAPVHLVTVVEPIPAFAYGEWESAAHEWSEAYLAGVADRCRESTHAEVTTSLRSGKAVDTLLAEVEARGVDVVVMATHGRGALSRAWLGSVADSFVRRAATPVLFVRPQESERPTGTDGIETILVPLDGSELSESALEHATELGELFDAAYHLTRVVSYPLDIASPYLPHTVQMNQELVGEAKVTASEYLEDHAERMRRHGLRVTTSVSVDAQPGHGILSEGEAVACDLIAMATHGRTGVSRVVLGSAADKVLRGSEVPTLLYRPTLVPA